MATAVFAGIPTPEGTTQIEVKATVIAFRPAQATRLAWALAFVNWMVKPILECCELRGPYVEIDFTVQHGETICMRFPIARLALGDARSVELDVPLTVAGQVPAIDWKEQRVLDRQLFRGQLMQCNDCQPVCQIFEG